MNISNTNNAVPEGLCSWAENRPENMLILDGRTPEYVFEPSSDKEAAQVLYHAAQKKVPTSIFGGATKISQGSPLQEICWAVSTKNLCLEPRIDIDDLIVNSQAGVNLKQLQEMLAKEGLFLPIDPGIDGETIGGSIACGGGGSHRMSYGLICDNVLGMTVALANGNLYRFGGKTVKNVAGYDVGKLFIGSKGTLGLITEVNLRVYAFPPASITIVIYMKDSSQISKNIESLIKLQPIVLEVYDHNTMDGLIEHDEDDGYFILIKYSGPLPSVDKKKKITADIATRNNLKLVALFNDKEEKIVFEKRAAFLKCNKANIKEDELLLKISVPPAEMKRLINMLEETSNSGDNKMQTMYIPGIGMAYVSVKGASIQAYLNSVDNLVKELDGLVNIQFGPLKLREEFYAKPWRELDVKIKRFFDPSGILNPGKRP